MTRSTLPAAVVLAVSVGLLLTACGGGDSNSADKIQPSGTASPSAAASTSATPTATSSGSAAPVFDLPSDITVKFEGFDSTDPTKKAVLTGATYAAQAVLEMEAKQYTKVTPNFSRFFTGSFGAEFADTVLSQNADGSLITGYYHYYSPVVKSIGNGNVSVQYCEDQRKAYAKDAKTGAVSVTTPSLNDFEQWTLLMTKADSGEWTVYNHTWVQAVKSCELS